MTKPEKPEYPYWWWGPESTKKLRDLLNAAGDNPRLEAHLMSGMNIYFDVLDGDGKEVGGENDSHICPPWC